MFRNSITFVLIYDNSISLSMEFKLIPIKEKPKKNDGGWLKQRTKKPDKYNFKGVCSVEGINIKKGKYL